MIKYEVKLYDVNTVHEIHVFELWISTKSSVYDARCENYLVIARESPEKCF